MSGNTFAAHKRIMKKLTTIILTIWAMQAVAQNTKPVHISVVQGVSTDGKESRNNDYSFSFNLFSGTVNSVRGVEIGSLYNQNEGDMTGYQTSGLVNYTKGVVKGYQTAGISNVSGDVVGFQSAGISNHARNVTGVQNAGIYNQAKVLKGLQIGLINVAETVEKGGGIGLVNLYKNGGYREVELSVADYQNIGFSFKSGTRRIYTIVNLGYSFAPKPLLSSGLGLGQLYNLKGNTFLKPELIIYSYTPDDFKFEQSVNATRLKLGLMKRIGNVGITLSPSLYFSRVSTISPEEVSEISVFEPVTIGKIGSWGYGLSFGVSFLK